MTKTSPFTRLRWGLRVPCLLLLLLLACSGSPPPASQPSPLLSRVLPSFEGKTLSLTPFDSAQGEGHAMVVQFFSSDCEKCKITLPALQRIYDDDRELVVVGVSEDESAVAARGVVQELGLRFPVIHDGDREVAKRYRVSELPAIFVIAPNGNVRWVGGPKQTEDDVRAALSAATD